MWARHSEEVVKDVSVDNMVAVSVALGNAQVNEEKQATLLKKALDNQAQHVAQLIDSVPKLATSGSVGTQLHVTA